jgi:hypothetical protein
MASITFRATLIDRGRGTGAKRIMNAHPERGEFIRRLTGWERVEPGTLTLSPLGEESNDLRPRGTLLWGRVGRAGQAKKVCRAPLPAWRRALRRAPRCRSRVATRVGGSGHHLDSFGWPHAPLMTFMSLRFLIYSRAFSREPSISVRPFSSLWSSVNSTRGVALLVPRGKYIRSCPACRG